MSNEKPDFMNSNRIKEIQRETAYPNSRSVHQALLKVWNECAQQQSKRTAQLEADNAELLRGLKDITRQFERVGRLYSLDQKAISAANALIQKHAAK
jgi:hypothetical protein